MNMGIFANDFYYKYIANGVYRRNNILAFVGANRCVRPNN